ncbi:Dirigent protein [Melia azedarach]|uniref:Dirigent protein n=1 Tax=Melia azedarach TaxID=155640 RepID=A0ACC1XZH8_MELAZ|nr:Dirigent protein [Melia azedarach]
MENKAIFSLALILCAAGVSANSKDYYKSKPAMEMKETVTQLHFFLHDILSGKNPSAVMVARPNLTDDKSPTPFGSVYAIDDALRVGPEPTSEIIGNAQGLYVSSSQDPKNFGIVMYVDFAFTTGEFNGSSFGVFSRNPVVEPSREVAVVGGRGKFRMARGFAELKTAYFNGTNGDAIIEYNVILFHY